MPPRAGQSLAACSRLFRCVPLLLRPAKLIRGTKPVVFSRLQMVDSRLGYRAAGRTPTSGWLLSYADIASLGHFYPSNTNRPIRHRMLILYLALIDFGNAHGKYPTDGTWAKTINFRLWTVSPSSLAGFLLLLWVLSMANLVVKHGTEINYCSWLNTPLMFILAQGQEANIELWWLCWI